MPDTPSTPRAPKTPRATLTPGTPEYTEIALGYAMHDVEVGDSVAFASRRWKVPASALQKRCRPSPLLRRTATHRLDPEQEEELLRWAREQVELGIRPTLEKIQDQANVILGNPADVWRRVGTASARKFVERYPELAHPGGGGRRLLNETQETAVHAWAVREAKLEKPPTVEEILANAQGLAGSGGDGRPLTVNWVYSFLRRHPGLEVRWLDPVALDEGQESALRGWIRDRCEAKAPPRLDKIQERAQRMLTEVDETRSLKKLWARKFLSRNPEIARLREIAFANRTAFHFTSCK